jgi:hypothetical protein
MPRNYVIFGDIEGKLDVLLSFSVKLRVIGRIIAKW